MAEVLNVLINTIQESMNSFEPNKASEDPADNNLEPQNNIFSNSLLYKIANEAKSFLLTSSFNNFANIIINPESFLIKLELSINALNMSAIALSNLELTYDSVLNVIFHYSPDVRFIS